MAESVARRSEARLVIIDSARTVSQIQALRTGPAETMVLHLTASEGERRRRFLRSADRLDQGPDFDTVAGHWIEREADAARNVADQVLDTTETEPGNVLSVTEGLVRPWIRT